MRVLHVNKFLYRRGGAEGYLLDVAELQRAAGDEVAYFGMTHPENDAPTPYARHFPPLVELEPAPRGLRPRTAAAARMIWSGASRRGLARVLDEFRPDVVHLHNIYHQLSPSVLAAARVARVPCVMTLHDYKLACPSYQMLDRGAVCDACVTGGPLRAARRRCKDGSLGASSLLAVESWLHRATRAYGPVQAFVSPSRFLADVMRRAGVFPDRMHVVRHFVDVAQTEVKSTAGGSVVFAGRLSAEKGVDVLIDALAQLPPEVHLDVAGDGPARDALTDLAGRRAPGRVRFHGRLDKARLHELIRSAAVAAVPSRWNENQPMAVLEAFACGVPVVTTDLGGLPELVTPGTDGEVVPADDPGALAAALHRTLADPHRAHRLGLAGRARVEREFSPRAHLERLREVYATATRRAGVPA
ncbi:MULTISPECIES: glycosyltransferase [Micromonospora]|uniref:Glycosyltransferase involved in cell wall bisynthesis n=1 Tax=Micromonospora yangpuensis TaxID=683228 RepID=A0A1C6UNA7_9ACTN|nr:glycosyltransferase [Micromonospora yangpuensis]GGM09492.1 glycosyl transferase [Micromonospora yangpuensis]SCL55472.1 Glycosyltransferase involved in cell wall bisynthesis [Micromonospora yangpuensis]